MASATSPTSMRRPSPAPKAGTIVRARRRSARNGRRASPDNERTPARREIEGDETMKLIKSLLGLAAAAALSFATPAAYAVGPAPAPLSPPVKLTIGYVKVGHLAPLSLVPEELKK